MPEVALEKLSLNDQLGHILEEARMVLPGIQALFGFQLIAVVHESFDRKLDSLERQMHLLAIGLTAVAIALMMAPAALHRAREPDQVSKSLVADSSRFLTLGMVPLLLALVLDFYLVCRMIVHDSALSAGFAGLLGLFFVGLWFVWPSWRRASR